MDFKKLLQNKNLTKYAVVLGVVGIVLIFLSDFFDSTNIEKNKSYENSMITDEAYCDELEKDAQELIKSITGDKSVKVIITLDSGAEYLYATDKNVNTDSKENISGNEVLNNEISDKTEESYIIINTGDGEQPLLLSALSPKVRGAAVVCDSGNIPQIAEIIKDSLCTLLDVSEGKISVAGGVYPRNEE